MDSIVIRGAREHNLKNIDVVVPRNKFVVITGVSGSGKSSLAFDTIFAEGQRRYVESLSAYARQFLEQMEKPDVDSIEGLSPAISIEQRTTSRNPRSTVGTVTEIYDYLRLLYASIGVAERFERKTSAAFDVIAADRASRERWLEFARDADEASVNTRMMALARKVGWLTAKEEQAEFLRMIAHRKTAV